MSNLAWVAELYGGDDLRWKVVVYCNGNNDTVIVKHPYLASLGQWLDFLGGEGIRSLKMGPKKTLVIVDDDLYCMVDDTDRPPSGRARTVSPYKITSPARPRQVIFGALRAAVSVAAEKGWKFAP